MRLPVKFADAFIIFVDLMPQYLAPRLQPVIFPRCLLFGGCRFATLTPYEDPLYLGKGRDI